MDVMCKIIPLYKVTIRNYDEKDDYRDVIVADRIAGLIEGIIDIEVNREVNLDSNPYGMDFDITDFLLMPCEDARERGFHLFDIDDVDSASPFASIDNALYDCYFKDPKNPQPVCGVGEMIHGRMISSEDLKEHCAKEDALMRAIYDLTKDHPYRAARLKEKNDKESEYYKNAIEDLRKKLERDA